jgi:hypothetical protein
MTRTPSRAPICVRIALAAAQLPPPELGNCANSTIAISEGLQRHIYRELGLQGGDTVVLVAGDREIRAKVLTKPTDCVLVTSDVDHSTGHI